MLLRLDDWMIGCCLGTKKLDVSLPKTTKMLWILIHIWLNKTTDLRPCPRSLHVAFSEHGECQDQECTIIINYHEQMIANHVLYCLVPYFQTNPMFDVFVLQHGKWRMDLPFHLKKSLHQVSTNIRSRVCGWATYNYDVWCFKTTPLETTRKHSIIRHLTEWLTPKQLHDSPSPPQNTPPGTMVKQ